MNEENQQEQQSTDAELEVTESTETQQAEANETEQNADSTDESLEDILAQYDEGTSEQSTQREGTPPADSDSTGGESNSETPEVDNSQPDSRLDTMWDQFQENARNQAAADIESAVSTIRDSSPILKNLPEYVLKGGLEELNRQDPRIGKAFALRNEKPEAWKDTLTQLGKKMVGDFSTSPDSSASEDVAAVRASVNSQSSGAVSDGPTEQEVADMSPAEFSRYKKEKYG